MKEINNSLDLNSRFSYLINNFRKKHIEIKALILRQNLSCKVLQGDSKNGLTVNSDLTITCNCFDAFGHGRLGDLNKQSMEEIFCGDQAQSFRQKLENGSLPIRNCAVCQNLRMGKDKIDTNNLRLPKEIWFENTVECNLSCLSCQRKEIYLHRTKKSMSLKDIEHVSKLLNRAGIEMIYYFNLGEPFFSERIKEEVTIIKQYNPSVKIFTSTNGTVIDTKEKFEAALLFDIIVFSLDGADQASAEKYQRNIDFDRAYKAMKEVVALRGCRTHPLVGWKYVVFRYNDRPKLVHKAVELAKDAGVDGILFHKTKSPLYGRSVRFFLNLEPFNQLERKYAFDKVKAIEDGITIDFRKN